MSANDRPIACGHRGAAPHNTPICRFCIALRARVLTVRTLTHTWQNLDHGLGHEAKGESQCSFFKRASKSKRVRLIWTQALHWAAVLITMNIMLLSNVQRLLPTPAMSLVLLSLLALGTFLAGLNLLSLQIGFLGLALALAVPAIAWLKNSMLFFILGAVFLIGLAMTIWLSQGDGRSAGKSHDPSVRR